MTDINLPHDLFEKLQQLNEKITPDSQLVKKVQVVAGVQGSFSRRIENYTGSKYVIGGNSKVAYDLVHKQVIDFQVDDGALGDRHSITIDGLNTLTFSGSMDFFYAPVEGVGKVWDVESLYDEAIKSHFPDIRLCSIGGSRNDAFGYKSREIDFDSDMPVAIRARGDYLLLVDYFELFGNKPSLELMVQHFPDASYHRSLRLIQKHL